MLCFFNLYIESFKIIKFIRLSSNISCLWLYVYVYQTVIDIMRASIIFIMPLIIKIIHLATSITKIGQSAKSTCCSTDSVALFRISFDFIHVLNWLILHFRVENTLCLLSLWGLLLVFTWNYSQWSLHLIACNILSFMHKWLIWLLTSIQWSPNQVVSIILIIIHISRVNVSFIHSIIARIPIITSINIYTVESLNLIIPVFPYSVKVFNDPIIFLFLEFFLSITFLLLKFFLHLKGFVHILMLIAIIH